MKLIITLTLMLGLGAGGYYFWKNKPVNPSDNENGGRPTIAVVEPRSIRFEVSAAGDIGPADQVSVRPEVNGRIEELPVDIGDKVKKGDLLCRLDDRDLQIERRTRLAEIDGARLQLEKADRNFKRSRQLHAQALISRKSSTTRKRTMIWRRTRLIAPSSSSSSLKIAFAKHGLKRLDCTCSHAGFAGQTVSGAAGFNSGTKS
jgi:HlyD family secretion protein